MRQFEHFSKKLCASLLTLLCIAIRPIEVQSVNIEIENLEDIVNSALDRVINEIDPTLGKAQNMSEEVLLFFEDRVKTSIAETFHWLQVNLFVLLFGALILSIVVLLLLLFLDMVLTRYEFKAEKRRFISLAVITLIAIWLLIAITVSIWPSSPLSNLETLEYILFGLVIGLVLYLICVWIRSIYKIRHRLYRSALETCGCRSYTTVVVQSHTRRQPDALEMKPTNF